jgi:hypothetical protein
MLQNDITEKDIDKEVLFIRNFENSCWLSDKSLM